MPNVDLMIKALVLTEEETSAMLERYAELPEEAQCLLLSLLTERLLFAGERDALRLYAQVLKMQKNRLEREASE